jgi:hypothetical protein
MQVRVHALLKFSRVAIMLAGSSPAICEASRAAETPCAAPAIEVAPKPGGQRQVSIQSPCRKGELVIGRYGDIVIMERLDDSGKVVFQIDCFLGDREIALTFADEQRAANHACARPDSALTKVAIVWRDRVDLDLHAFEYAALPGSAYDRSARNPGSYQEAQLEYLRSGRSHGFMSMVSDGRQLGHNIEVYTLLHNPAEPRGLIAMAVAPGANYDAANAERCNNSRRAPLRVDLDVYVLDAGIKLRSYDRAFAPPPCGAPPFFATSLIPNILLGSATDDANAP